MTATELAERLGGRRSGNGYAARCPAHSDANPSLSISDADSGGVVLHCHAGCSEMEVLAAASIDRAEVLPPRGQTSEIVASYDYTDEAGTLLFQVVRMVPKTFRQRRPDPAERGSWVWSLKGTRRVLYRLPEVLEAVKAGAPVFVTEGERDADAIRAGGDVATCNPGGAGKWRSEYAAVLKGADVVIVQDKDEPGRRHAQDVANALAGVAERVRIVEAKTGKDAADHLAAGHALEDLVVVDEETPAESPTTPSLAFYDLATLIAEVDAAPAPRFLLRPVWAEGDHGMLSAEDKAGKTWLVGDAAVSVASGTPWLGQFPVDAPGPVLLFVGEGGKRKIVRRLRAIAASKGVSPESVPIRVCMRVPHLTNDAAMIVVEAEVATHRPALVIIDPLYLAARGARGSDLYEMGEHLERIQTVAQRYGSALMISHHWNKTGEGRGAKRMSGVGPSAWGRVLVSAAVQHRHTDADTGATSVTLELDFQGDEIAERTVRVLRKVWSDNPEDLASPLHYEVSSIEAMTTVPDDHSGLRPSAVRVLEALGQSGDWESVLSIGDRFAGEGSPLKKRTIQDALAQLVKVGSAVPAAVLGTSAGKWRSTRAQASDQEERK